MCEGILNDVRNHMTQHVEDFRSVLPEKISFEKFLTTMLNYLRKNPDFFDKFNDKDSMLQAALQAAGDGMLIDGRQAVLSTFKGKAAYMVMIRGLLLKAYESGKVKKIDSRVVYTDEEFDVWIEDGDAKMIHRPKFSSDPKRTVKAVYATAETIDGGRYIEVMEYDEIANIQRMSKSGAIWSAWWSEMARKTVLRRMLKYMPLEMDDIVSRDDFMYPPAGEKRPQKQIQDVTDLLDENERNNDNEDEEFI